MESNGRDLYRSRLKTRHSSARRLPASTGLSYLKKFNEFGAIAMNQNILQLLISAVKEKRCIAVRYRDQNQIRVLEPHVIYTDDGGEIVADCFQTRGYSAAGRPPPFWRPFRIKKITALSVLKEAFSPRIDEGFSANKLKYRNGLIAIVDETAPAADFVYPFQAPQEMGPFLPKNPHRR